MRIMYDDKCNLREYDDVNSSRSNETYECVMEWIIVLKTYQNSFWLLESSTDNFNLILGS